VSGQKTQISAGVLCLNCKSSVRDGLTSALQLKTLHLTVNEPEIDQLTARALMCGLISTSQVLTARASALELPLDNTGKHQ
jgi:hypothetical protein